MRPVNLIPPEERRGESAPTRTGPLAYIVVGALALVLLAVTGVVVFDNKVSDREAAVAPLEAEAAESSARAESLAPFVNFQLVHDARVATVDGLAKSRFDWERVLRELSRVLPEHVWLTELSGSVSPEVEGGSSPTGLRDGAPGPALELTGCGRSLSDVARLVAAMEDIDGVTRVTVSDSGKAAAVSGEQSASAAGGSCQTRPTVHQFNLIAAFDEVVAEASAPVVPDPTVPTSTEQSTDPGTPSEPQQQSIDTATGIAGGG